MFTSLGMARTVPMVNRGSCGGRRWVEHVAVLVYSCYLTHKTVMPFKRSSPDIRTDTAEITVLDFVKRNRYTPETCQEEWIMYVPDMKVDLRPCQPLIQQHSPFTCAYIFEKKGGGGPIIITPGIWRKTVAVGFFGMGREAHKLVWFQDINCK